MLQHSRKRFEYTKGDPEKHTTLNIATLHVQEMQDCTATFKFEGEITCESVSVRSSPSIQQGLLAKEVYSV